MKIALHTKLCHQHHNLCFVFVGASGEGGGVLPVSIMFLTIQFLLAKVDCVCVDDNPQANLFSSTTSLSQVLLYVPLLPFLMITSSSGFPVAENCSSNHLCLLKKWTLC